MTTHASRGPLFDFDDDATFVTYCLLRCVDEVREETLNVGVLALDATAGRVEVRVTSDLARVARALPNVSIGHLQAYLPSLPDFFAAQARAHRLTPDTLADLAGSWGNGVRLSGVRSIAAAGWADTIDMLFGRFVETTTPPAGAPLAADAPALVARPTVTSRRIMRSVVSRLRRRGFREQVDLQRDAEIVGVTHAATRVPVWFPLLVTQQLLIDSMEVRRDDEQRSVDGARLLAAKAGEVLRASNALTVAFAVADSGDKKLDDTVASVILDEGRAGGRIPTLYWTSQLDDLAASAPQYQLPMPLPSASGRALRVAEGPVADSLASRPLPTSRPRRGSGGAGR